MDKLSYRRHRFPGIVIQQAVWLYFRFALSYRDVEDMLAERASMCPTRRSVVGL
jgi:putative transposase